MASKEYIEEEQKKIWERLVALEEIVEKKPSDLEKEARQSSKKASEYRNKTEIAYSEANDLLNEIRAKHEALQSINIDFSEKFTEIQSFAARSNELAANVASIEQDIQNQKEKVLQELAEFDELYQTHSEHKMRLDGLGDLQAKTSEISAKIEATFKNISNRKTEIDTVYYEIFGHYKESDSDEEGADKEFVPGKINELNNSYNEISDSFKRLQEELTFLKSTSEAAYNAFRSNKEDEAEKLFKKWENEHIKIKSKIRELLPEALTTGLSFAYSAKKTEETENSKSYSRTFSKAIWGLIFISLIPFALSIYFLVKGIPIEESIEKMPRLALAILPLYLPALWVAYSANKKQNLSKRLIEEYTHKEVISKTFEGLSTQISGISDYDVQEELKVKLLYNILSVNSENPGKLISDYNSADHPLMDALEKSVKLADAVEKLGRIPGFGKLSHILGEKSRVILENQEDKANAGLDIMSKDKEDDS